MEAPTKNIAKVSEADFLAACVAPYRTQEAVIHQYLDQILSESISDPELLTEESLSLRGVKTIKTVWASVHEEATVVHFWAEFDGEMKRGFYRWVPEKTLRIF